MLLQILKRIFFYDVVCQCSHISLEGEKDGFPCEKIIMEVSMCLASKKQIYISEGGGLYEKEF